MASSHQKGNGHSMFMNKSPHFFKIILQETLRDDKLGIPKEFIKKYGNGMLSPALLRVPSGEVWKVELRKMDGKVWLKNGWQEFANHYSLKHGHFLVFTYEGNSNFHVVIFDRTASEVEYPYTKEILDESDTEDDDSTQILVDIPTCTKIRSERLNSQSTWSHKKMRSTTDSANNITESDFKFECMTPQAIRCPAIRSNVQKTLALRRVYKSENPFFVRVMQRSYVARKCQLDLPKDFVRKHLMKESCEITLCNSEGKIWPVNFHLGGKGENDKYAYLLAGWKTFVRDNNIQVGDVCAFELMNCIDISFKVVKYQGDHNEDARASSPSQSSLNPLDALRKAKALQLDTAFRSDIPSFAVVMQPSYISAGQLSVPERFARRYLKKMQPTILHEVVLRLSNGKSWPVKYYQHSIERPSTKLRNGWKKFVVDNNLEVGDVCIFELTYQGTETSFRVTIKKKQDIEDANLGSSWAGCGANQVKIECKESLEINVESNSLRNRGDMSGMQNQHLTKELPVPIMVAETREIFIDFWLPYRTHEDKSESPRPTLKEAAQRFQTSQDNEAIQGTNRQGWSHQ